MSLLVTRKSNNLNSLEINDSDDYKNNAVVTPGEVVTEEVTWMKGHGTFTDSRGIKASLAGTVTRVNKLISVRPLKGRYQPEVGDHVIGRVLEVGLKRWKIEIGAAQAGTLMLGSINLPGGILRRKSESDEIQMRELLKEGDLFNAEVQGVFGHGTVHLHTRSLKYGKLRNGFLVVVPSQLIVRSRSYSHILQSGVNMLVGINGMIWLSKQTEEPSAVDTPAITRLEEETQWSIYSDENEFIPPITRSSIARYACCIKALAAFEAPISDSTVNAAYEASLQYQSETLMNPEIQNNIAIMALKSS
ncbi:hypothetical protein CANCADRAFT_124024 [Tortispora caseinolytica NRRL Y-17796]|uniref:Uncharacterized protein n=1 Tax=Tortispora caseinolytica NRRL Y-17796 TaxID=767744 RepID=A0A1E4T9T0_9ASCO|nr:hypothetical protein CANCADRAFT_124024 [Tortispora caseinolytica NRRL Y-17796]